MFSEVRAEPEPVASCLRWKGIEPAGFYERVGKGVTPYATYSCSARCLGAVLDRRGVRRLGAARLPHRTRPARAVPRAVLPGWPRPRRGSVGALARLPPPPRPDRLLGQGQVARWRPSAGGDPRPVGWFLYPPRARAAQQELSRNGGDALGRCAHRGGFGHLGRGSTQERARGLVARTGVSQGLAREPPYPPSPVEMEFSECWKLPPYSRLRSVARGLGR